MFDLCFVLTLDLFCFLDAVTVAAIRTVCEAAHSIVEDEPRDSFKFTCSMLPYLHYFHSESHFLWVVNRRQKDVYLVSRVPFTYMQNMDIVHFRAFWSNPEVCALRTAALRLDSPCLLRLIAAEALGPKYPRRCFGGLALTNGPAEFMCNCWIAVEQAHFNEHGHWRPLGREDALEHSSDLFYSKVHFSLWKYIARLRSRQHRDFRG